MWFWDELDRPAGRVGSLQRYEIGGFDVKKEEPTRVPLIGFQIVLVDYATMIHYGYSIGG